MTLALLVPEIQRGGPRTPPPLPQSQIDQKSPVWIGLTSWAARFPQYLPENRYSLFTNKSSDIYILPTTEQKDHVFWKPVTNLWLAHTTLMTIGDETVSFRLSLGKVKRK